MTMRKINMIVMLSGPFHTYTAAVHDALAKRR